MRTDIQLINDDINIIESDFLLTQSDEQHIIDTISSNKGEWKENPADGVGINQYLKSKGTENTLSRSIGIQLQNDKYKAKPIVSFNASGKLIIDPNVEL